MMRSEAALIVAELAPVIQKFVGDAVAPLAARNVALEQRLATIEGRPAPKDGIGIVAAIKSDNGILFLTLTDGSVVDTGIKDGVSPASPEVPALPDVAAMVAASVDKAVAALPAPKDGEDGKSVDRADVSVMVDQAVALRMADIVAKSEDATGNGAADILNLTEAFRTLLSELETGLPDRVERAVASCVAALPKPENGKDADPEVIRALVAEATSAKLAEIEAAARETVAALARSVPEYVDEAVAKLPAPKDGESADPEEVKRLVEATVSEMVAEAVAAIPRPRDGNDADPEAIADMVEARAAIRIDAAIEKAVAALPPAEPGRDVDMAVVEAILEEKVAAIPRPRDGDPGASITADDVAPMLAEMVARAVSAMPPAKDGVGMADAFIDRDGSLVVTTSDGKTKALGRVEGRDVDIDTIERMVAEKVASLPKAKDGENGLGFDDLDVVYDGERDVTLQFVRGDRRKEWTLTLPIVIDRGVFDLGRKYAKGDGVSFAGSFFISQVDNNTDKPEKSKNWRLAVKRGRDRTDPVKTDA